MVWHAKQPAHGTARLQLWTLSDYDIQDKQVILNFSLFDEHQIIQAHIQMTFSKKLRLEFTHYGQDPAQIALHSYFNLSQIENVEVQNLPMTAFDKLTDQQVKLPTTRQIQQGVDCIYPYIGKNSIISDSCGNGILRSTTKTPTALCFGTRGTLHQVQCNRTITNRWSVLKPPV